MAQIDNHFDTDLANALVGREVHNKHLSRPNTYLHKWWARRCGSTFRLILKHLTDEETGYYDGGGLEGKVILDPMMGGGTTLHEAIRLGANVVGGDIEPIPILQARASLTDVPLAVLEDAFRDFYTAVRQDVSPHFATICLASGEAAAVRHMLYGLRCLCDCRTVIMVDSLLLRHDSDGRFILCPLCRGVHLFGGECDPGRYGDELLPPLVVRSQKKCPDCGAAFREDFSAPFFARYEPVAVIGDSSVGGLFFTRPSAGDLRLIDQANSLRAGLVAELPGWFQLADGLKSLDLARRGVHSYLDLFSSRQLLYIASAMRHLRQMPAGIRLKLAMLVSTSLEFNAMLCGYKGAIRRRPGAVRHVFSRHAYTFPYTALENNPVAASGASGTLGSLFKQRIKRAARWAAQPLDIGLVLATNGAQPAMVAHRQPLPVDSSDSERFCDDCGRVLGWVLKAGIPEGDVLDVWQQALDE